LKSFGCRRLDTVAVMTDVQLLTGLAAKDARQPAHACVETVCMGAAQTESPQPWVCTAHISLCFWQL